MICKVCNSDRIEEYGQLYDDRYGYPLLVQVSRCLNCSHYMTNINLTAAEVCELYTKYYPRAKADSALIDSIPIPKGKFRRFWRWLYYDGGRAYTNVKSNTSILDVGCGLGEALGYHRRRGCQVYGVEADQNAVRLCKVVGLNVVEGIFDKNVFPEMKFDYVTLDQVVEHIDDPSNLLKQVRKKLNDKGYLIMSTPNGNSIGRKIFSKRWLHWHVPYHVNIYNMRSLKFILKENGFQVEKIYTKTCVDWMIYQLLHYKNFPKRGTVSEFWSGSQLNRKDYLLILIKIMKKLGLFIILTVVFDLLQQGDNIYVKAKKI